MSLLLFVLGVTLVGCRITGDFAQDPEAAAKTMTLAGKILSSTGTPASIQVNRNTSDAAIRAADLTGHLAIAGADVWLEEFPDMPHEKTDENGKYEFKNLPPGNYRVVARYKKPDNTVLKVRSDSVEIKTQDEKATAPDLGLKPAAKVVTGVLRDADGNFLKPGTVLTL